MARSTPSSPPPSLRQTAANAAAPQSTRGGAPQSVRPSSPPRSGPPSIVPVHVPPPPKPILLQVGDKAVHPAHGVGEVVSIEHRELGGTTGDFYILKILENGMKVMVPTNATSSAGLRPVMSGKEADTVLDTMRAREVAVDVQPWSRRFRAYTEMIKSGSPHEVAKVLRDMYRLKFDKDLSFGERRLLDQAKSLLMKELALAKKMTETELREYVADIFRT
jgi:CarD family transcriptional regulator